MKSLVKLLFLVTIALGHLAQSAEEIDVPQYIEGSTRVSAEELINLVGKFPNMVILDARKKSDYQKGYIEGAINVPNTEASAEVFAKYIKTKDTPVLFYCNGVKCGRSVAATRIAVEAGYKNVYWFRGGMEEWENKGLPLVFTH